MKQYANELYTQDNFQKLEREYKLIAWVEVYIENLLLLPKKQRDMQLIISIMNSPVTLQISEKLITGLFETFDSNQQIPLFYKINQRSILELLLKYYTEKYNSPEETFDLIDKYLKRYPDLMKQFIMQPSIGKTGVP